MKPRHILEHRFIKLLFILLFIVLSNITLAQSLQRIHIKGFIKDEYSGESLSGVSIYDSVSNEGGVSNNTGYFSLFIKPNTIVAFSHIGYRQITILVKKDTSLQITLTPVLQDIKEVNILGSSSINRYRPGGMLSFSTENLKHLPVFLGERDIIKTMALMPGITQGNEGTVGLFVRGGGADQNLFLVDNTPVYNTAHLFGFMSVFNSDAIKGVDFYKGFFPARFGGKLSSVVDITMKEGNNQSPSTEIGIGLINSRLLLEGPLRLTKKLRGSYLVAARGAYPGIFTLPGVLAYKLNKANSFFTYWMYDVLAKISINLTQNDKLLLSTYRSSDYWLTRQKDTPEIRYSYGLNWGNQTVSLRYHRLVFTNLFLSTNVYYSHYTYQQAINNAEKVNNSFITKDFYTIRPGLKETGLKGIIDYIYNKAVTVRSGVESIFHSYRPTYLETSIRTPSALLEQMQKTFHTPENNLFAEIDWSPIKYLDLQAGYRLTSFSRYTLSDPRLSVSIPFRQNSSLKIGYSKSSQFIHLLSQNAVGLPNDIWVPSTNSIPPQRAAQYALSINHKIGNSIELSVEGYFKKFTRQIDYQSTTSILNAVGQSWENLIVQGGIGQAYGLEFFINKPKGKLTGWLAYTLAYNKRKFDGINSGNWYFANYDRRHTINLVSSYSFSRRLHAGANWQFYTGSPITIPVAIIQPVFGSRPQFVYGNRNNFRLSSYHRLDLSISWEKEIHKRRLRKSMWSIGVYNAYNRANPYYIDTSLIYKRDGSDPYGYFGKVIGIKSYLSQVSVVPILPYLSYEIKLN